jgi:hypothetical protein
VASKDVFSITAKEWELPKKLVGDLLSKHENTKAPTNVGQYLFYPVDDHGSIQRELIQGFRVPEHVIPLLMKIKTLHQMLPCCIPTILVI